MLHTRRATRGMVVAPHHLAAQAGLAVLRDGGNAIEAAVATAAATCVLLPHMTGLGGDGFWLIRTPDGPPVGIDACGAAGSRVTADLYRARGLDAIPERGPLCANTVAGVVSGWQAALEVSAEWGGRLAPARLLEEAIGYARDGYPMTESQHVNTAAKLAELSANPGFAATFLDDGRVPPVGTRVANPALAGTLEALANDGLDGFYRGELARRVAADLERAGSPLVAADFEAHRARRVAPLSIRIGPGTVYNMPPTTQGLASLVILGIFDRLGCAEAEGFAHIHGLVEATKHAFRIRDTYITDPRHMTVDPADFLSDSALDAMAARVDMNRAAPWQPGAPADTVWLGVIDGEGRAVSHIHSIYWEFGSAVVLEETGIVWQNRGGSFSLDPGAVNPVEPGRYPFHTNNPAMAVLADGRTMVYGAMGGDGQPQSQAAVFTRYAHFGQDLQRAVTAPRWVLGRTWGSQRSNLRIEARVAPDVIEALREAGQEVEVVDDFTDVMGHAGALVHRPDGVIEAASDPRVESGAVGF